MPLSATLHPRTPIPRPTLIQAPSAAPSHTPTHPHVPRDGRGWQKPPAELLVPPVIRLGIFIAACLVTRSTLPVLYNSIITCLEWSLCVSCSIDYCKHKDYGAHHHLSGSEYQRALAFWHRWCQACVAPSSAPHNILI